MEGWKVGYVIVLISANVEWGVVVNHLQPKQLHASPLGEWFVCGQEVAGYNQPVLFFHGGWGKIAAAASTQYVIDRWRPNLILNLGTCGGFEGEIERGEIILVNRTVVYDIYEQMGDHDEHIAHYTTEIDLSWLGESYPQVVKKSLLVSGDRDLFIEDVPLLKEKFGAVAGDWESGSIAFVAARNEVRCLILRGVTDLVGRGGGEAYGNLSLYKAAARQVLEQLIEHLPRWLETAKVTL